MRFTVEKENSNHAKACISGIAKLRHEDEMTCFEYGGKRIRFLTSPRLTRYTAVLSFENGFVEVLAQYGEKVEEEYIDLTSILENLYIDPGTFLAGVNKVEVDDA